MIDPTAREIIAACAGLLLGVAMQTAPTCRKACCVRDAARARWRAGKDPKPEPETCSHWGVVKPIGICTLCSMPDPGQPPTRPHTSLEDSVSKHACFPTRLPVDPELQMCFPERHNCTVHSVEFHTRP